ncbi:MAG: response regulator [Ruthenibacterium sp.]
MVDERIRVLIADDDVDFCFVCKEQINLFPDLVCCGMAYDGHEAVHQIHALMPDVVLLDQIMPGLDGLGVLEQILENPPLQVPRFLACSASGQEYITRELLQHGADYFLEKPFDTEMLARRIRFVFSLRDTGRNFSSHRSDADKTERNVCSSLEKVVAQYVIALGFPTKLIGHDYIQNAFYIMNRSSAARPSLKQMYLMIAKRYDTDCRCVENAITSAIKGAMANRTSAMQELLNLLPDPSVGSLSNGKFLTLAAQSLRMMSL